MNTLTPRERFIEATIKLVAQMGMENLRTKHIATEVGMSEGSLFAYFKTKEDILRESFYVADKRFSDIMLEDPDVRSGNVTPENFRQVASNVWHRCFRYLIEHPEETLFTIRYRYSAYYTREVRSQRQAFNGSFAKSYEMIDRLFTETDNFYRGFFVNYAFELTLSFAEKIITGFIADTKETEERMWRAIGHACLELLEN